MSLGAPLLHGVCPGVPEATVPHRIAGPGEKLDHKPQCDFSPNSLLLGLSMCINSFLRGVRLFPGGVRLSGCLPIHLSPSLAGGARLSGFLSLNLHVSLHLLPTLSSGVRLSGRLFFAFTCLSSCVSRNVFPKLFVSQFSCLLSGGVWLFRLCTFACLPSFVSHHLSST